MLVASGGRSVVHVFDCTLLRVPTHVHRPIWPRCITQVFSTPVFFVGCSPKGCCSCQLWICSVPPRMHGTVVSASTQRVQACAGAVQCSRHACMCCVAAASPAAIGGTPPACSRTAIRCVAHTSVHFNWRRFCVSAAVVGLEILSCMSAARMQVCWCSVLVCQQLTTGVHNLFATGYKDTRTNRPG